MWGLSCDILFFKFTFFYSKNFIVKKKDCGVIQVSINNPLWILGSPRFACRGLRDQLMKQLAQNRAVMEQFIRDKQGLFFKTSSQIWGVQKLGFEAIFFAPFLALS